MTIQIPDDLAQGLEGIAAVRKMSVEQVAIERLRATLGRPVSPRAILEAIRSLPHPSASTVDDLEASIALGRLPVSDRGVFDR